MSDWRVELKVLISGGSGFIGSALTRSLLADGHSVSVLTRSVAPVTAQPGVQALQWDGRSSEGWLDVFSHQDVVVNLAGETVGRWPWDASRKKRIYDSRVQAGAALVEAYQHAEQKPPVLIQSSGIGFYGPLAAQGITEDFPAGSDFMALVARDWESSTAKVESMAGVRRVVIRTSLVLDKREGVLPLMAIPVQFFVGGPLGSGQQGVSWIHIEDEVRAIRFLIDHEQARGAFNLSAPQPLPNSEFIRTLAKAINRPYWIPAPAFVLKLALGEMSTLLLDGQFALPCKLQKLGFRFKFEQAGQAFKAIYGL